MELNIPQLKTDLRELEDRIRKVKKELRSTWTQPMHKFQYELINLKAQATDRYILRAWTRGRYHLADQDRCEETAERMALRYPIAA